MSVSKTNDFETVVPPYQQEAINWLNNFKNTAGLQDMLRKFRFSEAEIAHYRKTWVTWLKPKVKVRRKATWNAIH